MMKKLTIFLVTLGFWVSVCNAQVGLHTVVATGEPSITAAELLDAVKGPGAVLEVEEWLLDDPVQGAPAARLLVDEQEVPNILALHPELVIELDVRELIPAGDAAGGGGGGGAGATWALDCLLPNNEPLRSDSPPACLQRVWFYVVDTGVQQLVPGGAPHPEFGSASPVVWGNGFLARSLLVGCTTCTPLLPSLPFGAQFHDPHDHGTRVTSAAVGQTTGILSRLPGAQVQLESCRIYHDTMPALAWVSDAVNVITMARIAHNARRANAAWQDDGSVLVFANRTLSSYSQTIETALGKATQAGMVVVAAAGNDDSADEPAVLQTVPPPGAPLRSPTGLPPGHPAVPRFQSWPYPMPESGSLLLVGSHDVNGNRAPMSNYGEAVDLMAPGENVMLGDNVGAVTPASGTSMAAGYVAGLALDYLAHMPAAPLPSVLSWIKVDGAGAPVALPGSPLGGRTIPRLQIPREPLYCCRSFDDWKNEGGFPSSLELAGDPDDDGAANSLEFLLLRSPEEFNSHPLLIEPVSGGYQLSFELPAAAMACGCTLELQSSTDLTTWSRLPVPMGLPPSGVNSRTVSIHVSTNTGRVYYRLASLCP